MNSTKSMKYSITISKYKIDNGAEKVRAVFDGFVGASPSGTEPLRKNMHWKAQRALCQDKTNYCSILE